MTIVADVTSQARQRAIDNETHKGRSPADTSAAWKTGVLLADVSTTGLFALAVLAALYLMKEVVVPVILAWVVANILLPVVDRLERNGMPRILAVVTVTLLMVAVLLTVVTLLSLPLTYWLGRATELGALLRQKLQSMAEPLDFLKQIAGAIGQATARRPAAGCTWRRTPTSWAASSPFRRPRYRRAYSFSARSFST